MAQTGLSGQLSFLLGLHALDSGTQEGTQLELRPSGAQPCKHWLSTAVMLRAPMQTFSAALQRQRQLCRYVHKQPSKCIYALAVNSPFSRHNGV